MTTTELTLLPSLRVVEGWVYFDTDMVRVKIGTTVDRPRRGGQLKTEHLLTFEGGQLDERRHQKRWEKYRIPGNREWFYASPELLLWLSQNVKQGTREWLVLRQLTENVMRRSEAA